MKILDRVMTLFGGEPVEGGRVGIDAFQNTSQARAKIVELRAVADLHANRLKELRAIRAGQLADDGADAAADALFRGGELPQVVSVETEIANEERALDIANRAVRKAKAAYAEVRAAQSFEICKAVQPAHRRIVREMARHLAQAERLAKQETALRVKLQESGVELGAMIQPLSFPAFAPQGYDPMTSPYRTWVRSLCRAGVLREGEDPAGFEPDEAAGADLGAKALQAVANAEAHRLKEVSEAREARRRARPSAEADPALRGLVMVPVLPRSRSSREQAKAE